MHRAQAREVERQESRGRNAEAFDVKIKALDEILRSEQDAWDNTKRRARGIPYFDTCPYQDVKNDWRGEVVKVALKDMTQLDIESMPVWVQDLPIQVLHEASLRVRELSPFWRDHVNAAKIFARVLSDYNINWVGQLNHNHMSSALAVAIETKVWAKKPSEEPPIPAMFLRSAPAGTETGGALPQDQFGLFTSAPLPAGAAEAAGKTKTDLLYEKALRDHSEGIARQKKESEERAAARALRDLTLLTAPPNPNPTQAATTPGTLSTPPAPTTTPSTGRLDSAARLFDQTFSVEVGPSSSTGAPVREEVPLPPLPVAPMTGLFPK
jgi:hypothetical protein